MASINRILTSGDFSTLTRLCDEWHAAGHSLAPLARKLLDNAVVVFPSDLPSDVASLGSRLSYTENDETRDAAELTALLLFDRDYLPVRLPLGLALLGRREGESFDVLLEGGVTRRIKLEKVLEQPERTWPGRFSGEASLVTQTSVTLTSANRK